MLPEYLKQVSDHLRSAMASEGTGFTARLLLTLGLLLSHAGCGPETGDGLAPPQVIAEADYAIVDVAVIPMNRNATLAHQTVVIREDRVVAIGPAAEVVVPELTETIDGRDRFLIPGLADMQVHVNFATDLVMHVANGVTLVRNMSGQERTLVWRRKALAGEILGPTIVTAGPIVDGDPPAWPSSDVVSKPADARAIVEAQKEAGYDFIKVYHGLTPKAFAELASSAKATGMRFSGHVPPAVGVADAMRSGMASIEHTDRVPRRPPYGRRPAHGCPERSTP